MYERKDISKEMVRINKIAVSRFEVQTL